MRRVIPSKWRPSLLMVIAGILGAVLALPVLGLITLRWLYPTAGQTAYVLFAIAVLAGAAILGFLLWRLLLRPVRALSHRARRMAEGATPEPLAHYGTRELRDLGQVVLDMGRDLQARETAIRAYSDHITHELKSPTTAILGAAEMLRDADLSPQNQRLLDNIQTSGARMESLLSTLRDFAAASDIDYQGTSELSVVLAPLKESFAPMKIEISDGPLPINPEGLQVILGHLLENAARHGARHVQITVSENTIYVADDGTGISADIAAKMFEPFFTTRREEGGTGMGLAIVSRLLLAHGGSITYEAAPNGATFRIDLSD